MWFRKKKIDRSNWRYCPVCGRYIHEGEDHKKYCLDYDLMLRCASGEVHAVIRSGNKVREA